MKRGDRVVWLRRQKGGARRITRIRCIVEAVISRTGYVIVRPPNRGPQAVHPKNLEAEE